ncbi:VCBS repeat-containing protein [Arenibacter sp. GZD96]|uniref:FG-GAP repeat domain-containing protein n=1 Tax=Aurantibrevibacter litoralis TaxID=3106030 RepID=UPI002AFE3E61|nr:VCBS repeat-containing protein [Arenibacter sp. GZD-96]MEA1785333.1 VCBS repeat-containing protein [Arenibacter sp. GZD-96]
MRKIKVMIPRYSIWGVFFSLSISCSSPKEKRAVALYQNYCGSCHVLPAIDALPETIWESAILPEMGARLGVKDASYNKFKGVSFHEQGLILQAGVYPYAPLISESDWHLLKNYVLTLAPDTLEAVKAGVASKELVLFKPQPINLDSTKGSLLTFMEYNKPFKVLLTGDLRGNLRSYDFTTKQTNTLISNMRSGITAHTHLQDTSYSTLVGYLDPSEQALGSIVMWQKGENTIIADSLHRPVHTLVHDLDKDGIDEIIVSEFGDFTGQLSLLKKDISGSFLKTVLLKQPGVIRVVPSDMDKDGKDDLVVLTSQGNESITILYQKENLQFAMQQAIRFSPVYGSSWFELADYNGDGHMDIITVNGDNADKSYVHKPYHGMRIHLNDGQNNFQETYFYPLNGATRVVARDFDKDGDIDFGLLSTFPDYDAKPELSFVYLENKMPQHYHFQPYTFTDAALGRWFLMDAADVDGDGDEDIVLSSFTYAFTPVPKKLSDVWKESDIDILWLENTVH